MSDCIFCKIVNSEIPAKKLFENKNIVAFADAYPKANIHILVIPKKHIKSLENLTTDDSDLIAEITLLLPKIAKMAGAINGFRTIINTGDGGKQEVDHLHYHILNGGFS